MWHIIFLLDKWTVFVWSKIRSAENNQSCKRPWEENRDLDSVRPPLVFGASPLTLGCMTRLCSHQQSPCDAPHSVPSRRADPGLMMNMKMCLNIVVPLQLGSLWRFTTDGELLEYATPEPKSAPRQRRRQNTSSHPVCKLVRWHNCQVPASCDSCSPLLPPPPLHYRTSDAFTERQKGNGCMFFYRRPVCQLALKS